MERILNSASLFGIFTRWLVGWLVEIEKCKQATDYKRVSV